jgi:hypothetical protein
VGGATCEVQVRTKEASHESHSSCVDRWPVGGCAGAQARERDLSPRVAGPTIYVTHSSEDARALAEEVLVLAAGRLAAGERPWESEDDGT